MASARPMGFFGWLKEILFGGVPRRPEIVRPAPPPKPAGLAPAPAKAAGPPGAYDAGDFLPISQKELREKAAAGEVASSPWWGRTDTIPPGGDARTRLIDRALVTRGYLTPEQLAEIHRVGDLMLLKRGDDSLARQEAAQAVRRMKEERAAVKARKKREAEERRQARAAAVAERRAGDIVFLGRGVSGGLAYRASDAQALGKAGLSVLSTPAEIAAAMRLAIPRLRWLAFHSDAAVTSHYVRFQVPKKSGGMREISAPRRSLEAAQRWILENILARVPAEPAAHGFVPGRSTLTNARPHVGRAIVVNLDLTDFFPSITFPRVRGVLEKLGYSPAAATILALLSTEAPRRTVTYEGREFHVAIGPRGLPQGACTSPALSNLAARRLDRRLGGLAARLGWTYTRYADDLTFSGDTLVPKGQRDPRSVAWLLARTRHIIADEGFEVNEKKLRVQRRNTAQLVTGIVVNDKPSSSRKERRRLRAILHRARFEGLARQNRDDHPNFAGSIKGKVAYISMVNADQGRPLKARLESVLRSVRG